MEIKLTTEWDKTFPRSEKTDHRKVTFRNCYGITLAADLYQPRGAAGSYELGGGVVDPLPEDAPSHKMGRQV